MLYDDMNNKILSLETWREYHATAFFVISIPAYAIACNWKKMKIGSYPGVYSIYSVSHDVCYRFVYYAGNDLALKNN